MSTKNYVAVCAVAVGKKIINPGEPIPNGVAPAKITAWLRNDSIKEADAETTTASKGVATKEERLVELNKLSAAALKKLAAKLEIVGAAQMEKDPLFEAILAVEFAVKE
jgi:hypothetical protein